MNIKGFRAKDGTIHKYDYNALENVPEEDDSPDFSGSWNDLTDKPFSGETVYYEWNEEVEYSETVAVSESAMMARLEKISDDAPEPDFFIGKTLYARASAQGNETAVSQKLTNDLIVQINPDVYAIAEMFFVVCTAETGVWSDGIALTKGIWHTGGWKETAPIQIFESKLIDPPVPLDEKYIPDTIARVSQIPVIPVRSVNGQTGDVEIDVGVTAVDGKTGGMWLDHGVKRWEDLQNRPFADDVRFATFDYPEPGEPYCTNHMVINGEYVFLYWADAYAPKKDEIIGALVDMYVDGSPVHADVSEDMIEMSADNIKYRINLDPLYLYVVPYPGNDGTTEATFQRTGMYFGCIPSRAAKTYVSSLSWNAKWQLNEKHIPDTIARVEDIPEIPDAVISPATASIGQTIIVKAVDESGKPTAWEAVDLPTGGTTVTDEHINDLIDAKLGVIENGTY